MNKTKQKVSHDKQKKLRRENLVHCCSVPQDEVYGDAIDKGHPNFSPKCL